MSSDQDDSTLSGLPPLPSAGYRPDEEGDAFTSVSPVAESVPGGVSGAPGGPGPGAPPPFAPDPPAPPPPRPARSGGAASGQAGTTSNCVVMGPSQAGKTVLLVALDQACSCPADDRFTLELVGGDGTDDLAAWGIRTIMEGDQRVRPTDRLGEYTAWVTATEEKTFWRPAQQHVAHLVFRDGPGGALFPARHDEGVPQLESWESELLRDAREAETLVLCVDATDPRPDLVSRYMRKIIAELADDYTPEADLPLGYRMLRKLRLGTEAPPLRDERRINATRFLLLLTKVDQLLARPLDWDEDEDSEVEPPRPADLAAHLSPVETACELLDESNLLRILNALKPTSQFAVGLTSAWGFNPYTGRPFMEDDEPVGPSAQDRSQRLLNWRPFGVREALLFITAGVTQGPVERVKRRVVSRRQKRPELDVEVPPPYFEPEY